ncbi:MAG: cytochrome P450 [Pleurocapsa sp. MO_226.B13]|nr:cytochrome P450 [Pleurocapsa sp. MO_226.B13]
MKLAASADTIAGFNIPQDAIIFISPYITHRHPQFWKNTADFQPDRFTIGESATKRHKFAYFLSVVALIPALVLTLLPWKLC